MILLDCMTLTCLTYDYMTGRIRIWFTIAVRRCLLITCICFNLYVLVDCMTSTCLTYDFMTGRRRICSMTLFLLQGLCYWAAIQCLLVTGICFILYVLDMSTWITTVSVSNMSCRFIIHILVFNIYSGPSKNPLMIAR